VTESGYLVSDVYALDNATTGQWTLGSEVDAPMNTSNALWTGTRLLTWGRHPDEQVGEGKTYRAGPRRWTTAPHANAPYGWTGAMMARVGTRVAVWGGDGRNSGSLWHDDTRTGPLSTDLKATARLISQASDAEGEVRYRVTATNLGPSTATAVTLDFKLDAYLNYEGVESGEALCRYPYSLVLSCTFDALAPGESRDMIVVATLNPAWRNWGVGTAIAHASVRGGGTEADPVPGNNAAPVLVLPVLTLAPVSVVERNSGTRQLTFVATLSQAASQPVSFDVATANGTASAGSDYVAANLVGLRIPAGQLSKTFSITINGDTTVEATETLKVVLDNLFGANAALDVDGKLATTGYIVNDDGPVLSIDDVAVVEGNAGTTQLTFTVSLSQAATVPVGYSIATSDGNAKAGSDYVALDLANQVIPAGQLSKTHVVTINGDTAIEANEVFVATLRQPTGATLLDNQGLGTITNDD